MTHTTVGAPPAPPKGDDPLLLAYIRLRTHTGRLALALPWAVLLGALFFYATPLLPSISAYYYSGMTSVFNGVLWAIATFLFIYNPAKEDPLYLVSTQPETSLRKHSQLARWWQRLLRDEIASSWAGIFAILITLFPTTPPATCTGTLCFKPLWGGILHVGFAACFFGVLIYFALCLFRKTHPSKTGGTLTENKKRRNRVYLICGWVMVVCTALIVLFEILRLTGWQPDQDSVLANAIFFLETVAIEAFGFSWMVKGEVILKDGDDIQAPGYLLTCIRWISGIDDTYHGLRRLVGLQP